MGLLLILIALAIFVYVLPGLLEPGSYDHEDEVNEMTARQSRRAASREWRWKQ